MFIPTRSRTGRSAWSKGPRMCSAQRGQNPAQPAGGREAPRQDRSARDGERFFVQGARARPMRQAPRPDSRAARLAQDAALRAARCGTLARVLPSRAGRRGGPCCDAAHRRDHLQWPFYGSRRMRDALEEARPHGQPQAIQRLMRQMDLRALYPAASNEPAEPGAQDLSLPAQGPVHRARKPGLGK